MRLVDVHCHLECAEFEGRIDDILRAARDAGLVRLVSAAVRIDAWDRSAALARDFIEVECALGVHPWYATQADVEAVRLLEEARTRGAKAIGEIGLDSKVDSPPFDLQQAVFERQLTIAKEIDLPVVVHCRGAFNELIQCAKQIGMPASGGMVHAYSGSVELAEDLLRLGFYFSMGRSLTYRNSKKRQDVLKRIYPDRFLLETDSPDLPPVELPGTTNVPANLVYMLRAAAELLGEPEERVAEATTQNADRLFGLGL